MDPRLDRTPSYLPYACRLEAQPDHLTPAWLIRPARPPAGPADLFFNEGITRRHHMLWVPDPATHVRSVFTLHPNTWTALREWRSGGAAPAANLLQLLRAAGIITTAEERAAAVADWQDAVSVSRSRLRGGFAPIRGLLHPFQLSALRRYFRCRIRRKQLPFGDPQCSRRYVAHDEPVASFFHRELAHVVSDLLGTPVKPSYCYFISYQPGAELPKHVDREQCQYTLALCLDFSPEPACETTWPLKLQTPSEAVVVYQALGDALLYEGRRLPHFRNRLAEGCTSTSILFHYVDEGFSGPLS